MAKRLLLKLISGYRRFSVNRPRKCRFFPSCSEYAMEAIEKYGAVKGSVLSVWRILRCNPFGRGGFDPVP